MYHISFCWIILSVVNIGESQEWRPFDAFANDQSGPADHRQSCSRIQILYTSAYRPHSLVVTIIATLRWASCGPGVLWSCGPGRPVVLREAHRTPRVAIIVTNSLGTDVVYLLMSRPTALFVNVYNTGRESMENNDTIFISTECLWYRPRDTDTSGSHDGIFSIAEP